MFYFYLSCHQGDLTKKEATKTLVIVEKECEVIFQRIQIKSTKRMREKFEKEVLAMSQVANLIPSLS